LLSSLGVCRDVLLEGVGTPPQECSAICNLIWGAA